MGSETRHVADPRAEILAAIPHRPPFLFVDRIVEHGLGKIVTEWDVRADLPAFAGHYPGNPVLPGETLRAELETRETLANVRWMSAHVTSAGETVLRIRFAVALLAPETVSAPAEART